MIIQFNTDNHVKGSETKAGAFTEQIKKELNRFSAHLTRIEVHLSDEDGAASGPNTKRCKLEARLEGKKPIAVSEDASSEGQALTGAINKLKSALDTVVGKSREH